MICFGAKTDQEVKENVTCGSHLKKKQNKQISKEKGKFAERERERNRVRKRFFFFYFLFLLSLLSLIYENRTVRIRRRKKQSALLNKGYAWEQKTRDFAEFLIKIRKILCFGFSQIYGFLPVRIGRSRRSN